jgi:hypothetical protein
MYKEWILSADQWIQEYWEYSGGKLWRISNDNKDGSCQKSSVEIDQFLQEYEVNTEVPYPEMVSFLKSLSKISENNNQIPGNTDKTVNSPTLEG